MTHDYGKCHVCGNPVEERCIDHSVRDGDAWLLIRGVPTGVCTKCGEQILRWQVLGRLEELTSRSAGTAPVDRIEVPVFAY
jgi:YgiT-type zinc finger domain-containing protein